MSRRPPRSTRVRSSAASDVYKKQSCEGEPLLLSAGQRLIPRRIFLDLVLEVTEADLVECFADLLNRPVLGCGRIGCGAAQRAQRHVRLLPVSYTHLTLPTILRV